ncbi:TPR_REGION domain-containing protein [Psidium guajava]|nr:TPR_REGION domain-containing protein [Psidium guajava]
MAPKRKSPTPDSSSGEESRTPSVPPRAEEQRKEDVEVENPEEENESSEEPAKSHDEARSKKPSPDPDSSSGSKPEDGTRPLEAVATDKEITLVKKDTGERSGRFQRLWSEKDEIKLLRGMIKFRKKKRLEPSTNIRAFKDYLNKKSVRLDFDADESQFYNKIRHMKLKYMNGCKTGRVWKKPHDQKVSELSRVFWGDGKGGKEVHLSLKKGKTPESASKVAAVQSKSPEKFEDSDWAGESTLLQLTSMGLGKEVLRIGMGMIDSSEMEELKEKWRQLRLSELQVASDRAVLMNSQAKLFMDCYCRAKQQE